MQLYIAEISSPKWKGFFGNCNQLFITLGIAVTYFLSIEFQGYQIHYSDIALVGAGVSIIFEVLMMVATLESPRWLLSKSRYDSGTQMLGILRGKSYHIAKEIDEIKAKLRSKYPVKEQLTAFKHRPVYHPFILVIFLFFFQEFSGIDAAVFYSSQIFSDAGYSSHTVNLVSFGAVGCVLVLATLISVVLVDYLGRRILLLISSGFMVLSSFILGIYFLIFDSNWEGSLETPECPNGIEYLAIASVVVFIIGFSLGWGPVPFSAMSELLPAQARTLGGSMAAFTTQTFSTIIIFTFPSYVNLVTPKFAWWTFSVIMLASVVFVVLFLPEAKGKSLEEIQEYFESGRIIACSCPCWSGKSMMSDLADDRVVVEQPPSQPQRRRSLAIFLK